MNYMLLPMTDEDWKKVFKDADGRSVEIDILWKNKFEFDRRPVKTWAIDRDNDSYLLVGSAHMGVYYYNFFYKNNIYVLTLERDIGQPERLMSFCRSNKPNLDVLHDVVAGLKAAFFVYGSQGDGNEGLFNAVVPVYK